jgi:hypothetical protein
MLLKQEMGGTKTNSGSAGASALAAMTILVLPP